MGEFSVSVEMFLRLYLLSLVATTAVWGDSLRGKHLTISTVTNTPYLIIKDNSEALTGNDRYEGILVDLLDELSSRLGFTYTLKLASDGRYGVLTNTGEWTGMVGEVVRGEADMAVADMTVTSVREMVIDFTHPYMYSGLSVLYSRQGDRRLRSLEDVLSLDSIKVGTFQGGSTMNYFKHSTVPTYQRIWAKLQRDGAMTQSNQEGVDRVLEEDGGYAYIMEAPSMEYAIARNCDLIQVGKVFSPRSYALALPQGSSFVEEINRTILRLKEDDVIDMIIRKWVHQGALPCPETTSNTWHSITDFISTIFV